MPVEIRVPALGESIVDAVIARWIKKEGETVQKDEALVELETDKVNVEVPALEAGVLQKILKEEGATVAVGEVLALIGDGAAAGSPAGADSVAPEAAQVAPGQQAPEQGAAANASSQQAPEQGASANANGQQRPVSPLARRVAEENNVNLEQIQGGVPWGRVMREDVYNYLQQGGQPSGQPGQPQTPAQPQAPQAAQQPGANVYQGSAVPAPAPAAPAPAPAAPKAPPAPAPADGREERIRMSRRRQTIASRLVEAQQTAAMLTTFNEIDMSAIIEVRSRRKDAFKERHGIALGFMSFFTKAVVGALKAFPRLNAEIQGDEFVLKKYYDIGVAVGAEEGLVVPVVRDADKKSFADIEREIADLAKKARTNTLSLAELQGGTFTITNGGIFGSLMSTPILNAPQVGILGMHKIQERPVAIKGQVVIRPMMYVALSYDHRIVDGREAVQFLVRVKELAEDPEALLLEG